MKSSDYQAPPPDAGGHLGAATRPEDLRNEPRDGPSPELHTDPARGDGGRGFALGVGAFFAVLVALSAYFFFY